MLLMLCCCSEDVCNKITFTVKGCNDAVLEGAHVEVCIGGTVYAEGDTNASGVFETPDLASGTYSYTITHARFQDATGTVVINCPDSDKTVTRTLTAHTDYVCCPHCVLPVKKTLVWTTSAGTVSAVYNAGSGFWVANQSASTPNHIDSLCATKTENVTSTFNIKCPASSGGKWRLEGLVPMCCCGANAYFGVTPCPVGDRGTAGFGDIDADSGGCAAPTAASFSIPTNWGPPGTCPTATAPNHPISGTGTLSE